MPEPLEFFRKDPFETSTEYENRIATSFNAVDRLSGRAVVGKRIIYDIEKQQEEIVFDWAGWSSGLPTMSFTLSVERDLALLINVHGGVFDFRTELRPRRSQKSHSFKLGCTESVVHVHDLSIVIDGVSFAMEFIDPSEDPIHLRFRDSKSVISKLLQMHGAAAAKLPITNDNQWDQHEFEFPREYSSRIQCLCNTTPAGTVKLVGERYDADTKQWPATIAWEPWVKRISPRYTVFDTEVVLCVTRDEAKSAFSEGADKPLFVDVIDAEHNKFTVTMVKIHFGGESKRVLTSVNLVRIEEPDWSGISFTFEQPKPTVNDVLNAAANAFSKWLKK